MKCDLGIQTSPSGHSAVDPVLSDEIHDPSKSRKHSQGHTHIPMWPPLANTGASFRWLSLTLTCSIRRRWSRAMASLPWAAHSRSEAGRVQDGNPSVLHDAHSTLF